MKDTKSTESGAPKHVRYLGETNPLELTLNRVYAVVSVERGWYRFVDETDEDYLYPPGMFEIVD